MSIVDIHGCGWVLGDIIVGWGTERSQSESRITIVSRTPEQPKHNQNTRFDEEGQGRLISGVTGARLT